MALDQHTKKNLELALQGLADALGVPLALTDADGKTLVESPPSEDETNTGPPARPGGQSCKDLEFNAYGVAIIQPKEAPRRFVVRVEGKVNGEDLFVQSGDLPDSHPWIDGHLRPEVFSPDAQGVDVPVTCQLGVYLSAVYRTVVENSSRAEEWSVGDLDVENIRRITVCLRKNIEPEPTEGEPGPFSLERIPRLEEIFPAPPETGEPAHVNEGTADLTTMLTGITSGAAALFNVMALSETFVTKVAAPKSVCKPIMHVFYAPRCFASNIEHLVQAALAGQGGGAVAKECWAGLTEVFAAIFVDGLVVGVVFGGQLLAGKDVYAKVRKHLKPEQREMFDGLSKPEPVGSETIDKTREIVSALAALVGLLFEKFCLAANHAALRRELLALDPGADEPGDIFRRACLAIKRFLAVSQCSAFRLEEGRLVLAATTCTKLAHRKQARQDPPVEIDAEKALGKAFYERGEGLTGSVLLTGKARFWRDGRKSDYWSGKWSERPDCGQCLVAPIKHHDKIYGVIRAVGPKLHSEIPKDHRDLIASFAEELAIVLHNRELREQESEAFKQTADELQSLLGDAAHEFRAPLHHVLSLSTWLRYATLRAEHRRVHQEIKEEVYRAKRIVDNYLMRAVLGKEELKYNFQPNDLGKLVRECASRFEYAAIRKGLKIDVESPVDKLPGAVFDKDRVDQVLSNILENAVKYAFAHTKEKIPIQIKANETAATVTITVIDFGLGIPAEAYKDIFAGFQRVAEDKRRFKRGTGLGLRIAKEIIDKHGGNIYVESEAYWSDPTKLANMEGYFTRFTVALPKSGPPSAQEKRK